MSTLLAVLGLWTTPVAAAGARAQVTLRVQTGPDLASDGPLTQRIEQALHQRLLEDGFELVLAPGDSDTSATSRLALHIDLGAKRWEVVAQGVERIADEVTLDASTSEGVALLELVHKSTDALERAAEPAEPRASSHALEPEAKAETQRNLTAAPERDKPPQSEPATASAAKPITHWLGAQAGAWWRSPNTEPVIGAFYVVRGAGLGLRAVAAYAMSGPAGSLDISEFALGVGPFARWAVNSSFAVTLGAEVGARVHHYSYSDKDSGTRATWAVTMPVGFSLASGQAEFGASAALGITGIPPTHVIDGAVAWQRSSTWAGLSVFCGTDL